MKALWAAAAASLAGAAALARLGTFEAHAVAFLGVLAAWTAVSVALWRALVRRPAPASDGAAVLVLAVAAALRLILLPLAPTPSTDAYRYSWEGRVAAAGRDPYRLPPDSPALASLRLPQDARVNHAGLTSVYPPLALVAFASAGRASPDVRAQKALFALCDLAVCLLLVRLLRRRGRSAAWAALYAWHPLAVVESAAAGHLDFLMLVLLLGGLELWESGREEAAASAWAAGALVKVAPLVALPFLAVRRPRAAALLVALAALGLVPALGGLRGALAGAPQSGAAAYASGWLANPSLHAVLGLVLPSELARRALLAALLLILSVSWARRCGGDAARYLRGALAAVLLVSPVVQPWYVLWLLPFAVLAGDAALLAWSWAAGFLYVVLDPALMGLRLGLPLWHWVWLGEYGLVYGLLLRGALARAAAPVTNRRAA